MTYNKSRLFLFQEYFVAESKKQKKSRRLRPAETMRQRAEKHQAATSSRWSRLSPLARPFKSLRKLGNLRIWRPLKTVGRFLTKILIPPYIRHSFSELRKVTWPTRLQTFRLTTAVILFALIFGTIVAIVDFGLDKLFKQVILR